MKLIYEKAPVLITGASQGIGRNIAITFAAETNRPLILLARNRDNLNKTAEMCREIGASRVEITVCDATSADELELLNLPEDLSHPGLIINNAGAYLYKHLAVTTEEEFRKQIDVNLFAAVNVVNRFLPGLRQMDRGLIINICSVASLKGLGDSGAYSASKHALLGYTRSLRRELIGTKICVTAVNLGQTHSTSWQESDMSPDKLIDPSDLSKLLVTLSQLSIQTVVEEIAIEPQNGSVAPM